MSKEIIAVVRLTTGESGYYDDLSRIHLTAGDPQREIFAGTNCTQLRRSIKSGRLRLLSGSLSEEKKLDLSKKGNKFTGEPQVTAPAHATTVEVPVTVDAPFGEVAPVGEAPVKEATIMVEAPVEESGVVEITPVQPKAAEEVTEEGAKKKGARKKGK